MGINGLLPILKSITKSKHVKEYKGCKVAVDVYCWLHRGAYGCAQDLCEGKDTSKFVNYCMSMVEMLLHFGVKPLLVFDGNRLPLKLAEENERQRSRKEHLERALAHQKEGNTFGALQSFQRAVDITPKMAKKLIDALEETNVEFLVAPYEADAQMAYLAINKQVDVVITEDSDLLAYGCPKVMFKMTRSGDGQEICLADLPKNYPLRFDTFTHQMFLEMCIMAGCDFLKGLPKIGIKKSYEHISKMASFLRVIKKVRLCGTSVPETYHIRFQEVIWLFRHQRVFCPETRKLVHLKELPKGGLGAANVDVPEAVPENDDALDFLGPEFSNELAAEISRGAICPMTKKPFEAKQEEKENLNCNIVRSLRPIRKTVRVSGLRPRKKATHPTLIQFWRTEAGSSNKEDDTEENHTSGKTENSSLKSQVSSGQQTQSDVTSVPDVKEQVLKECSVHLNNEAHVSKRVCMQTPMSTALISGLDDNNKDSHSAKTECAQLTMHASKQAFVQEAGSAKKDENEAQENEEHPKQSSDLHGILQKTTAKAPDKFESIEHITYFAKSARSVLSRVRKDISKNQDSTEAKQELKPRKSIEEFKRFAFKHIRKKRTFAKI